MTKVRSGPAMYGGLESKRMFPAGPVQQFPDDPLADMQKRVRRHVSSGAGLKELPIGEKVGAVVFSSVFIALAPVMAYGSQGAEVGPGNFPDHPNFPNHPQIGESHGEVDIHANAYDLAIGHGGNIFLGPGPLDPATYAVTEGAIEFFEKHLDTAVGDTNPQEVQAAANIMGFKYKGEIKKEGLSAIARAKLERDQKSGVPALQSMMEVAAMVRGFYKDEKTGLFTHIGFQKAHGENGQPRDEMVRSRGWEFRDVVKEVLGHPRELVHKILAAKNNPWFESPKAPPADDSPNDEPAGPPAPTEQIGGAERPGLPEGEIFLIDYDQTPEVHDEFMAALESTLDAEGKPMFEEQLEGLAVDDITIFALGTQAEGNYFAVFTDPVTAGERVMVRHASGQWVELQKVFDPDLFAVAWVNWADQPSEFKKSGGIATPQPADVNAEVQNGNLPQVVLLINVQDILNAMSDRNAKVEFKFIPPVAPGESPLQIPLNIILPAGGGTDWVDKSVNNLVENAGIGFENRGEEYELVFKFDNGVPGIAIPDAVLDENGFAIKGLDADGNEIDLINIPLKDLDERAIKNGRILIINDENGSPQAIFDAEDPAGGWIFADPDASAELGETVFRDADGNAWVLDGDRLIDTDTYSLFAEHGFDTSGVDFEVGEDGVVRGYFAGEEGNEWLEPGKLIYEDGKFDIPWAVLNLDTSGLKSTNYEPEKGHGGPEHYVFIKFLQPGGLEIKLLIQEKEGIDWKQEIPLQSVILLDPKKLAWGYIFSGRDNPNDDVQIVPEKYLAYFDSDNNAHWFEVLEMDDDELDEFREERANLVFA